jgi:hypothetical protein
VVRRAVCHVDSIGGRRAPLESPGPLFHPPAGIIPLVVLQTNPDWSFLLGPVAIDILRVVVVQSLSFRLQRETL